MRVAARELQSLPLEVHGVLADVPLRDVSAVDLPGGGSGRTLEDVRALLPAEGMMTANPVVRALFGLRWWLGRRFGWDRPALDGAGTSYLSRLPEGLRARSVVPAGTREGFFRLLYRLPHESLAETRNATVHAFLCAALRPHAGGYRLYWAVYVQPTSWLTPLYMAAIEPFRRFVVYPAIFRRLRSAWSDRYRTT